MEAADENAITTAAMNALLISSAPESEAYLWAVETMKLVKESRLHETFNFAVNRDRRRRAGERFPEDFQATDAQISETMATSLGIDLSNERDPIARIVRIGIADLNPERVLRDCEHLSVRLSSAGILAEALRLPTAGGKTFRCAVHGYAMGATSLDRGHELFKLQFCDRCSDKSPRAASWVWKPEGEKEE